MARKYLSHKCSVWCREGPSEVVQFNNCCSTSKGIRSRDERFNTTLRTAIACGRQPFTLVCIAVAWRIQVFVAAIDSSLLRSLFRKVAVQTFRSGPRHRTGRGSFGRGALASSDMPSRIRRDGAWSILPGQELNNPVRECVFS